MVGIRRRSTAPAHRPLPKATSSLAFSLRVVLPIEPAGHGIKFGRRRKNDLRFGFLGHVLPPPADQYLFTPFLIARMDITIKISGALLNS